MCLILCSNVCPISGRRHHFHPLTGESRFFRCDNFSCSADIEWCASMIGRFFDIYSWSFVLDWLTEMEGIQFDYEMDSRDPKIACDHYWSWASVRRITIWNTQYLLWPFYDDWDQPEWEEANAIAWDLEILRVEFLYIHHSSHKILWRHAVTPLAGQVRHNEIEFYVIEFIMSTGFGIVESINCSQNCLPNIYEFDENSNCSFQLMLNSFRAEENDASSS